MEQSAGVCVCLGNGRVEEWQGGKNKEMAGPSDIWEGAAGARADLGLGGVMPDEAAEEGGVLEITSLC